MKTINNELIRSFYPCYDPSTKGIPDNETLTVHEWVEKYRNIVPAQDILWLLLRNEFYTDKQLRLFAVWCAREALKLVDNPNERSINACDVSERYANGEVTDEELHAARNAAWYAARNAERDVEMAAERAATLTVAWAAEMAVAWAAERSAEMEKQLNHLLTL